MADRPAAPPAPSVPGAEDDRTLVERARRGDEAAFRGLVERHQARVLALAWRLTGVRDDAEEVAQDAFVRAWRALPQFRGDAAFGTWLHRIVTHVALDRREAAGRRRAHEVAVDDAVLADLAAAEPGDAGGDRVTARTRTELLAALSEAQRTAVVLHYLEDRPVLEVAQAMDVPENTVKTHLARARAAMRAAFVRGEFQAKATGIR
jgi:RNA polymerase sigma-70 factor (ECF subfamily)